MIHSKTNLVSTHSLERAVNTGATQVDISGGIHVEWSSETQSPRPLKRTINGEHLREVFPGPKSVATAVRELRAGRPSSSWGFFLRHAQCRRDLLLVGLRSSPPRASRWWRPRCARRECCWPGRCGCLVPRMPLRARRQIHSAKHQPLAAAGRVQLSGAKDSTHNLVHQLLLRRAATSDSLVKCARSGPATILFGTTLLPCFSSCCAQAGKPSWRGFGLVARRVP